MNEIGIVIKGTQSFVTLLQLREDTMRRWQSAAQKRILTWTWTHWPPISDFQPPELWEIDLLFIDWCCCCSWVASIVSNSVRPHRRQPTRTPGPGILQARSLEWVAISFSNAWKWKVKVKSLSRVRLLATPWLQPTRLLRPWDFLGKSTGVGCHCLLHIDC